METAMNNFEILIETLECLGAKRKSLSFKFLKPNLLIKHKETGFKYTVFKVAIDKVSKKPVVYCYRYRVKKSPGKKLLLKIGHKDFTKYNPV